MLIPAIIYWEESHNQQTALKHIGFG